MNADAAPMNVLLERVRLNDLSHRVIGAAQKVSSTLGSGFLEKVYENSLYLELTYGGLRVAQQLPLHVSYRGRIVGDYIPDLLVEDSLIVEIKAVTASSGFTDSNA